MHSLGFGALNGIISSSEFLRATVFHNVAVVQETLYFVQSPDMHKLSTMPDGIAKASDSIITATT